MPPLFFGGGDSGEVAMRSPISILLTTIAITVVLVAVSCGSGGNAASVCAPGAVQVCPCGGGLPDGTQVCNADGAAWGVCSCGKSSESGKTDARPAVPQTSGDSTAPVAAPMPSDDGETYLIKYGTVDIPKGKAGEVQVVVDGLPYKSGWTAFVVQNNTPETVYNVSSFVTAKASDGMILGTSTVTFQPIAIKPGEQGFGITTFRSEGIAQAQPIFEHKVKSNHSPKPTDRQLKITRSDGRVEKKANSYSAGEYVITGELLNPYAEEIDRVNDVSGICFDERGVLVRGWYSNGIRDKLGPNETIAFEIHFRDLGSCNSYWLSSTGRVNRVR